MRPWTTLLMVLGLQCACMTPRDAVYQLPEVTAPHGIAGYRSVYALFYVVPTAHGVVLVDTGFEKDAATVFRAVGGRPVLAVLVTHGHVDHFTGAHLLGNVPTYVGQGDVELVLGMGHNAGLLPWLAGKVSKPATPPLNVIGVQDGQTVEVDGARFHAVAVPGHTRGSTTWVYRDVMFTGDALSGDEDGVTVAPAVFSDNDAQARRSVRKLYNQMVTVMLDGHAGKTLRPLEKLQAFLDTEATHR